MAARKFGDESKRTMPKASALYMQPPQKVALRQVNIPEPRAEEVLVRMEMTGISPGTELRCLAGKEVGAPEGFIPGYQGVGRVIAGGEPGLQPGERVFLHGTARADVPCQWGGHVSHAVCSVDKVYKVAAGVPSHKAAFAKLAAITHHGLAVGRVALTERVAVVGLGPIGFFSAQILQARGIEVTAFDLSAARVDIARSVGIAARCIRKEHSLQAQILAAGVPDVLIDATGVAALIPAFIEAGRDLPWADHALQGMRLVIQGSYPGTFEIDYKAAFIKELSIHIPRDHHPADVCAVLALMADEQVGIPESAVELVQPERAGTAYESLGSGQGLPLSYAIDWRG